MFLFAAILSAGVYLMAIGSIINAKDFGAMIIFKIMPLILGIWCLWEAALIYLAK